MASAAAGGNPSFDIDLRELDQHKGAPAPASSPPKPRPLPPATPASKPTSPPPAPPKTSPAPGKPAAAHATGAKPSPPRTPRPVPASSAPHATATEGAVRYTVKPGDFLFRILVREFGLSDSEAEQLIPEVVQLNQIQDRRKLTVGQTLLIPRVQHSATARKVTPTTAPRSSLGKASEPAPPRSTEPAGPAPPTEPTPSPGASSSLPTPAPVPALPPAAPPSPPPVTTATPAVATPTDAPALIKVVTGREPGQVIDALLEALSIPVHRNAIIAVDGDGSENISVKVDRFFVDRGTRYVVSLADKDSYTYTLYRILELRGYAVIQVGRDASFAALVPSLLERLGRTATPGRRTLSDRGGEREFAGFYVAPDHPREVGLFIADGTAAEGMQESSGGAGERRDTTQ